MLFSACEHTAQPSSRQFALNETLVRGVRLPEEMPACTPESVLPDLLRQIGGEATIFPTENYYYFQFYQGGRSYSGDVRLPADIRDEGYLQYVCYETYARWRAAPTRNDIAIDLGPEDGATVTRIDPLTYDVAYGGELVRFYLNNLDQTPNLSMIAEGEVFAGRGFDESGLIFDLLYDPASKRFLFVLNRDDPVPEHFDVTPNEVYVGRRTGFVFYEDIPLDRLILIAVQSVQSHTNTPYDGPFDQLAENFYEELGFLDLVFDAYPNLEGQLTAHGTYIGEEYIFSVSPYHLYTSVTRLGFVDDCKAQFDNSQELISCLTNAD